MDKRRVVRALFVLLFLVAANGVMQASAISGSLPFVVFNATQNGPNLLASTQESAATAETSGPGTGDFAAVPVQTVFGSIIVKNLTAGSGGSFALANGTYGAFVATGGSIVSQSADFLNIDLTGTFVPGPGIPGVSPGPVDAHLSFTQTGPSLSGSFTLASVPEPGSMALVGTGILLVGWFVRRHSLEALPGDPLKPVWLERALRGHKRTPA